MPTLPVDGQTGWGDILNAYITALNNNQTSTASSLTAHTSNSPADPHGDRAFASSLVSPITTGVNGPNGYVKANSSGVVPAALIYSSVTGGAFNNVYDAVAEFSAVPNTGADQTTALQNALNACQTSGGIVYIGPGKFSIKSTLHIWDNTLLLMTPGTIIQRIPGTTNAQQLLDNYHSSTTHASSNIVIYGGTLDAYGTSSVTSVCTPLLFVNGKVIIVDNVRIASYTGTGPAVEVSSCSYVNINRCMFDGYNIGGSATGGFPAVRVNNAYTATMQSQYSGILSSSPANVQSLIISNCIMDSAISNSANGPVYTYFAGSDLGNASNIIQVNKLIVSSNISLYGSSSTWPIIQPSASTNWTNYNLTDNMFYSLNTGSWSNVTPPTNWSGTLRYKWSSDNELIVDCLITASVSPSSGNFTIINSIQANLQPANGKYFPVVVTSSGTTQPSYGFLANSNSQIQVNVPASTTRISFCQHIPLD